MQYVHMAKLRRQPGLQNAFGGNVGAQKGCAWGMPRLPSWMKFAFLAVFTLLATSAFAQRPLLCCDYSGGHVTVLGADGKIEWQVDAKNPQDCWRLPNGNILF